MAMIHPYIFGGERSEKTFRSSPSRTLVLDEVRPELGQGLMVRQVFSHFQNLNLRVLIENLRHGLVTRGNWFFADDLCPVAHGLTSGATLWVLRYLSQAVDLPRACQRAAQEMGVPSRFLERFVQSWDSGTMSQEWLLEQLEGIWSERQADADAFQNFMRAESTTSSGR